MGLKVVIREKQQSDNDPVFQEGGIVSGKNCLTSIVRQVTCNNCYFLMSSSGMQTLNWLGIQSVQVISTCKGGLQAPPPPPQKKNGANKTNKARNMPCCSGQ